MKHYATRRNRVQSLLVPLGLCGVLAVPARALQEEGEYRRPPESVREIFDRDKNYATLDTLSPEGTHFLVPLTTELSTLEKMAEPTLRLAMLELRPRVDREWHLETFGIYGLRIMSLDTRAFRDVQVPEGCFVSDMMFSPDGHRLAFLAHLREATQVWTADVDTGRARPLSDAPVMATLAERPSYGRPPTAPSRMLQWTPRATVLALLVPSDRGPQPTRTTPSGPVIRRNRVKPAPTRTQRFLLRDAHDKALFRYYTTAQLAELSPGGPPRKIGTPGMYLDVSLSPDGAYILVEKLVEPFSYIVGFTGFPRRLDVMDLDGNILSTLREIPLQEDQTRRASEVEEDFPREVSWLAEGSTLGFLWREQKQDGQQGEAAKTRRDRIATLGPPFDLSKAQIRVQSPDGRHGFAHLTYAHEGRLAFVTVEDRDNETESIVAYDLSGPEAREHVLAGPYDPKDPLALPGEVWTQTTSNGIPYGLLSSDHRHTYLLGEGYHEDFKPRPFIDRVDIASGSRTRVFEGSDEMYEEPLVPLDENLQRMIFLRESKQVFPDSFLWSEGEVKDNLTNNHDPFPEITAARRIDFTFTRRDGLEVHGRISLPVNYREGRRVPAIFWTYPREYSSPEEYERAALRRRNHNAFTHLSYLRWSDIWLTQGYALVYPDVPIIKKANAYNDNFVQHLVDTLYAAIRKVDEMGYVDIDRIGHGGHSYGAFATANLLAHTPYFKAGIAGNGAYNRTLTPMGFQSEKRFIWDAQDLYFEMSPFFNADHVDTPLLMYHGADDNNTGTYPIQSERFMQALTGLGKTAVLYVYPFESHTPRAKKTYLDLWARWLEWFDRYVKGADGRATN